jgi:hypothetical protein
LLHAVKGDHHREPLDFLKDHLDPIHLINHLRGYSRSIAEGMNPAVFEEKEKVGKPEGQGKIVDR